MKIKVANIIEDGRLSGPQVRITQVSNLLNKNNFKKNMRYSDLLNDFFIDNTVVFPSADSGFFKRKLEEFGVKYKQLHLHRLTKEKKHLSAYLFFFIYEVWLLCKYFKKNNFDIIHVSGGSWQIKGILAGKLSGSLVIWHLNDTKMPFVLKILFKLFFSRLVDGFIVAADKVRQYYLENNQVTQKKPVFEIQAPVDCSFFDSRKVKYENKIKSAEGFNIVVVGNINPVKGIEFFLGMAAELNEKYNNLNFWIVGGIYQSQQKYYEYLLDIKQNYKLDNCYFYGPSSDVKRILKSADIYVCSSIAEASPISVWEAMAMEKRIVSTDVGDVARFIKHGFNGYISEISNSHSLAENVALYIDSFHETEIFGKRSREIALKNFDTAVITKLHENAYKIMYKIKKA